MENETPDFSTTEGILSAFKKKSEPAPAIEKKPAPTTTELASKASDIFSDPRGAGAALGAVYSGYRSGASFNPAKPYFLQYNPRFSGRTPPPHPTNVSAMTPVYETATGQASQAGRSAAENMLTNQVANKSFATAPEGAIKTLAEHGITGPTTGQLYHQTGPTHVQMIGGKPIELPLGTSLPSEVNQVAQPAKTAMGTLSKLFPGVQAAGEWIKGALPTLKAIGTGAGAGMNVLDVGSRLYQNDKTGAGIAGAGAIIPMIAAPEIGIPVALGSAAINYLRDHPEMRKKFMDQMMSKEKSNPETMANVDQLGNKLP